MALQTYRDGVWHDLSSLKVFRNGAWRKLRTLKVYRSGTWQIIGNFIQPLSLAISPSEVDGGGSDGFHSVLITSAAATATPAGGIAPYSYAWAQLSGDAMTILAPTSAMTQFRASAPPGRTLSATFQCTCADNAGSAATASVFVQLTNFG